MTSELFSAEKYAASRRPLAEASPLPGSCYVSPEWYERELETIFRKEWLCVGRVDQVPNPGDFYTIPLLGQPLIVARDQNGKVNVLSAICRHRGAVVVEGEGRCRQFMCPYHNWTYALDGALINTPGNPPPMDGSKGFDRAQHGLKALPTDFWTGFIFVTFNPSPKPLMESLGTLPAFLANYRLENMQFTHRDVYEVECNWKVWLENAFENYHVPTIHRKHIDPAKPQNWQFEETDGVWEAMYSRRSIVAYTGLPTLTGLTEKEENGLYHIWLKPSLQIIITSSSMKYRQYLPEGPEKLRLIENWTFPGTTVELPQFSETVGAAYYHKYSEIIREDLRISPNVQRGMRSGVYTPGRYSLEEFVVHRIANYVLDRVLGPAQAPVRAARDPAQKARAAG
ncbi:MAG: aromatic ring-hydroxylating dioxygenase subunit alpha [Betaproteobacteria bacterium]|nr:aromatic ring-hydroxylating dioxygenase subunit alpha [Betaproteobacteria bacterium]